LGKAFDVFLSLKDSPDDKQEYNCSSKRHQETSAVEIDSLRRFGDKAADKTTQERTSNSNDRRHDDAHLVGPGQYCTGDQSNNKARKDRPKNMKQFHSISSMVEEQMNDVFL
jgi:hypothetical protein